MTYSVLKVPLNPKQPTNQPDVNYQVANGVDWLNKSANYRKRTAGTLRQLTSGRAPHHFSFISVELEAIRAHPT